MLEASRMSANMWGGLLVRTQAKRSVKVVSESIKERELFKGVERLLFCALPGTKLTWVAFEPIDADSGNDQPRPLQQNATTRDSPQSSQLTSTKPNRASPQVRKRSTSSFTREGIVPASSGHPRPKASCSTDFSGARRRPSSPSPTFPVYWAPPTFPLHLNGVRSRYSRHCGQRARGTPISGRREPTGSRSRRWELSWCRSSPLLLAGPAVL